MWCSGGHQLLMSSVNTEKACSLGTSTTIDDRTDGLSVSLITGIPSCLYSGFECGKGETPESVEVGAQLGDPVGVQLIDAAVALTLVEDEAGFLQHFEM